MRKFKLPLNFAICVEGEKERGFGAGNKQTCCPLDNLWAQYRSDCCVFHPSQENRDYPVRRITSDEARCSTITVPQWISRHHVSNYGISVIQLILDLFVYGGDGFGGQQIPGIFNLPRRWITKTLWGQTRVFRPFVRNVWLFLRDY